MGGTLIAAMGMLAQLHGLGAPNMIPAHVSVSESGRSACLVALKEVVAGTVPMSDDFSPVDCPPGRLAVAFRYDAAQGDSRVARNIAKDEIIVTFPEFGTSKILAGQTLRLVSMYGVVRVERQVTALQPAWSGQRLFVRSEDGQVFSVRYEAVAK